MIDCVVNKRNTRLSSFTILQNSVGWSAQIKQMEKALQNTIICMHGTVLNGGKTYGQKSGPSVSHRNITKSWFVEIWSRVIIIILTVLSVIMLYLIGLWTKLISIVCCKIK